MQAVVHDGDGHTHVLDLDEEANLPLATSLGANTIVVADGAASIVDADCPNGDCLRQRAISKPGQQLICLPHRLWVEIVPRGGAYGELDVDSAIIEGGENGSVDTVSR